ncbi:MAG: hypothetical protein HZA51_11420 [Planctomycetes bacterium]|nr:hypothetical protein [Planctomycetota bacterium]
MGRRSHALDRNPALISDSQPQFMTVSDLSRDDSQAPAAGWLGTFLAPVTFFIRPRATLSCVLHGSAFALALAYVVGLAVLSAVALFMIGHINARTETAARLGRTTFMDGITRYLESPFLEHFMLFNIGVVSFVTVSSCIWAILWFPDLHRAGPIRCTVSRAVRMVSCTPWLLVLYVLMAGAVTVIIESFSLRPGSLIPTLGPPATAIGLLPSVILSFATFILLSSRAVRLIGDSLPSPEDRGPLCEGCGYDLSHVSAQGVCTECGKPLAESLELDAVRPGSRWEARDRFSTWLHTSYAVLTEPYNFYRLLKLRTSIEPAMQFARKHFVYVGMGGGLWVLIVCMALVYQNRPPLYAGLFRVLFVTTLWSVAVPCIGWVLHRAVFFISTLSWFYSGAIPDARWSIKVRAFESAYLWWFCGFNGIWISLLMYGPHWMKTVSSVLRMHPVLRLGLPWELLVLLVGNASLILAWMVKYRRILRAIRWSNS